MPTIRIDSDTAERIVAQVLRDECKMLPANANAAASAVTRRLLTSMPAPTHQKLQGHRIIAGHQPIDDSFNDALSKLFEVQDIGRPRSSAVWRLVFLTGIDLPDDIADARSEIL